MSDQRSSLVSDPSPTSGTPQALARRLEEREQLAGHLEKALTSRSVIDQALGVIIARTGTDAVHAFKLLRAQSQHTNEKLRDVAAQIVKQASTRAP